jgi:hypothetical protein
MERLMSDAQHETLDAPFAFGPPSPMPQFYPFSVTRGADYPSMPAGVGRGINTILTGPPNQAVRAMVDFAEVMGEAYDSPFGRSTYCNATRAEALRFRSERYLEEESVRRGVRRDAALPTWILSEAMIPHQVTPQEAIGWFTFQLQQGEDGLIQLARTEFDEASVETVFTGRPERMWETTTYQDNTVSVYHTHTLEEANRMHTGCVARLIAHFKEEPRMERRKRQAVPA